MTYISFYFKRNLGRISINVLSQSDRAISQFEAESERRDNDSQSDRAISQFEAEIRAMRLTLANQNDRFYDGPLCTAQKIRPV